MKQECTEVFLHYREIARLVWNVGFWSNPKLREWDSVEIYREAMARLFEGLILHALGYQGRIHNKDAPGEIANFQVTAKASNVELHVDKNRPDEPSHIWGDPLLYISCEPRSYRLRFVRFFDWYEIDTRDFRLLEVLIEHLDERPHLVGHHALVELVKCSISLVHDENLGDGVSQDDNCR